MSEVIQILKQDLAFYERISSHEIKTSIRRINSELNQIHLIGSELKMDSINHPVEIIDLLLKEIDHLLNTVIGFSGISENKTQTLNFNNFIKQLNAINNKQLNLISNIEEILIYSDFKILKELFTRLTQLIQSFSLIEQDVINLEYEPSDEYHQFKISWVGCNYEKLLWYINQENIDKFTLEPNSIDLNVLFLKKIVKINQGYIEISSLNDDIVCLNFSLRII